MPVAYVFSRQVNGNTAINYDSTVQYWKQIRTFYNSNLKTAGIANQTTPSNLLRLYPNPASQKIVVELANQIFKKLVITGMTGRSVYSFAVNDEISKAIDVSGLPIGVYTLTAETVDGFSSQKFVISR